MSPRILIATAGRVLRQLRHDHRTVAMLLAVPVLLLVLVDALFPSGGGVFDRVALVMLGVFPFIIMFLVTSIAMLRERTSGTLERLLSSPASKADLLGGYGLAFSFAAAVQATVVTAAAYLLLDLDTDGPAGLVVLVAVVDAVLGVAMGLLASAFARTEFQAVQFMPVVVVPQLLGCGLFAPREQMADWLQTLSDALPLTYGVEALREVGSHSTATAALWQDLLVVAGVAVLGLALSAATLRRRTP